MSVNLSLHTSKSELFSTTSKPNWYVVYTKPRHEFKVNERLTIMGLSTYCPSITKVSQWSDRKKKIKTPALPSMILVNIKENERDMVFDCPGVVRYMFSNKKIVIVPQNEVEILKNHLEGRNCLNSSVSSLNIGDKLNIEQFQNRVGEIVKVTSNRVWVRIRSLNIKVRLDII
jgi:transcription antitermination factor NusG